MMGFFCYDSLSNIWTSRLSHPKSLFQLKTTAYVMSQSPVTNLPHLYRQNGIGQLQDTGCTPLGAHVISENLVIIYYQQCICGTSVTGRNSDDHLAVNSQIGLDFDADFVVRWLWRGFNKRHQWARVCDTKAHYIYIRAGAITEPMGIPLSHGCIRMRNQDIICMTKWILVWQSKFCLKFIKVNLNNILEKN